MMTINFDGKTLEVQESDSSYRYRSLMAKPQLYLKFSLPYWVDIPVNAWVEYQNEKYYVLDEPTIKKNGTRNIEYSLTMGTDESKLGLYKFRNSVDHRLKWSMTAKPIEFIQEIVNNLNKRSGTQEWTVGTCIESNEKTIEFNHVYIDAALSSVAETFETEWEIVDHCISLHKVEYFKEDPLTLAYGRGNGFVPGVGRSVVSGEKPIKRLYVQGGDRNIDRSVYGSAELLLPKNAVLEYEGRTYKSDEDGYYIERTDKVSDAVKEDSLDCSSIYPSRVGTVTAVEVINESKNFYDFIDSTIPEDLNFNDYIIAGETPTIRFQTGMLAGEKDFEFKYKHAERRFEIVPQEIDGITMPNSTFRPQAGENPDKDPDTYAIFGIMLPPQYICNDEDKSGASWDMFREAARHLYENEDQKFTFTGTLQSLWAKRNWGMVGVRLKVGGYINFYDEQFAQDGSLIRITGIKDYLTSPHAPTLELSNSKSGSTITSDLRQIESQEIVIEEQKKDIIAFTRRRFRDAKETLSALEDSLLNYSNSINPITVQTMGLLVGDESLQFRFVESKENLTTVPYVIEYSNETKQLHCQTGFLQHMTLGIKSISSQHADDEYKVWQMAEYLSPVLTDADQKYYLYARVSRTDTSLKGDFLLSETAIDMDASSDYYYLLVGVLNSEYDGERSYVDLYGFTEILPSRITTDRIVSGDGQSFIDLANNALHIGDGTSAIDWNNEEEGTLALNNATIKNALKVLGEALIAGFYFSDERIRSSMMAGTDYSLLLDGKSGRIKLVSTQTGGVDDGPSLDGSVGSTISIDSRSGMVEARNKNGVSYVSASGVFSNNAKTNALPASSGYIHYGSIVGLGFGNVKADEWSFDKDSTIIAGVYGRASNSGTAPSYGGYFSNLKAAGLMLNLKYVTDSHATTALTVGSGVTQLIGLSNKGKTAQVYLPTDGYEGRTVWAKQVGQGAMRIQTASGQKLHDDITANDYYDISEGQEAKITFTKFVLNGESIEAWLISVYKY